MHRHIQRHNVALPLLTKISRAITPHLIATRGMSKNTTILCGLLVRETCRSYCDAAIYGDMYMQNLALENWT